MADQRAQYTEEAVAAGHPTKADVMNRLALIAHNNDGYPKLFAAHVHKNAVDQGGVVTSTFTKVTLSTLSIDPGAAVLTFEDANDRLVPKIAGKWLFYGRVGVTGVADAKRAFALIYKNGAAIADGLSSAGVATDLTPAVQIIADMNGTTDYVELFVFHDHGADRLVQGRVDRTYLEAAFLGA